MTEILIIGVFSLGLLLCVGTGFSIIYPLLGGYVLFFTYGLIKDHSFHDMVKMSLSGVKTVRNILITFILIGIITAVWRASGTIPFIIYYATKVIVPSIMLLMTFLLCCLVSVLTGTAFGTAATMGVICMTMGKGMGLNSLLMGGAVLSGVFFGDRCSPMSTSALLISELTKTDIFSNIKSMIRTSLVPFGVTCILYLVLGFTSKSTGVSMEIQNVFSQNFNLSLVTILPAALIIILSLFKLSVKKTMVISICVASVIALAVQGTAPMELLRLMVIGFHPEDSSLSALLSGGGIISMVKVMAIICISSCYAGIFSDTGILDGIKGYITKMGQRISPFGTFIVISVFTSMISCNQTLSIMLAHQLCKDLSSDKNQLALDLENTAVVISPMVPWSIAAAVPLSSAGAPIGSIIMAFYLFLLPLWNCFYSMRNHQVMDNCHNF